MKYKFALRNYSGEPTTHYLVDEVSVEVDNTKPESVPSHLVFVVDCSGSMYYDISEIRPMIEKLLAVEEFHDANMLTTLISYAGNGDVRTHFSRVPVEDVMGANSAHQEQIRQLRTRGLTCVSQSLREALTHIRDGETTCISLHSDGYANDRSPSSERAAISTLIGEIQQRPGVFVNTVAYNNWSDFQTLSWIANECSGSCVRASTVKQVYESLHNTSRLLAGDVAPVAVSEIGNADLQVFVSGSGQKVVGSTEDLSIRGLSVTDDKTIYRYTKVPAEVFSASEDPECGTDNVSVQPAYAFARAQISMGNLNAAKFAMVTARNGTLLNEHYRALTGPDIAEFSTALESFLYSDPDYDRSSSYGLAVDRPSVLNVVDLLMNHTGDFLVDMQTLRQSYVRRGIKRVPGQWVDGELVSLPLQTKDRGDNSLLRVSSFDVNRANASINMLVNRPISLVKTDSGEVVEEVAGVRLDLKAFNNYTIVGDGEVTVPVLPIRISSKQLFNKLSAMDLVEGDFDPKFTYGINLSELPLVDFDQKFSLRDGVFTNLAALTAIQKFLSGLVKGTSATYTPEQMAEFKEHYLSPSNPSTYVNFPTVNTYENLEEALEKGVLDVRNSYKISIGSTGITSLSKLHSGNKCFERFFAVNLGEESQKKPKLPMVLDPDFSVEWKNLSARTKLTPVDDFQKPIFGDLLGMTDEFDSGLAAQALINAGVEASSVFDVTARRTVSGDAAVEILDSAVRKVNKAINRIYREDVVPLAFFVGSTGLVPDELGAVQMDSDAFAGAYADAKLAKAEKEGTFFVTPNDQVVTVFAEAVKFSTGLTLSS